MTYQDFTHLMLSSNIEKMQTKEELKEFAQSNNLKVRIVKDHDLSFVYALAYKDETKQSGFGGYALTNIKPNYV